nr:MAG TPA: hypothetical protein [Caudoviricetes sp.]
MYSGAAASPASAPESAVNHPARAQGGPHRTSAECEVNRG